MIKQTRLRDGEPKNGKRVPIPEYAAYNAAKQRCCNPRNPKYGCYGGRGIEFRFKSFQTFFLCVGPRPRGRTLDRKDNNGHYEPGNVRWATRKQQYKTRRPFNWRKRYSSVLSVHGR